MGTRTAYIGVYVQGWAWLLVLASAALAGETMCGCVGIVNDSDRIGSEGHVATEAQIYEHTKSL